MFERYTEPARRVIFFARYEASCFGAISIEPEHLLLGLLRQDPRIVTVLSGNQSVDSTAIRESLERFMPAKPRVPTSVDMPLAPSSKAVLTEAAKASDRLEDRHIRTDHLLLALVTVDTNASRVLSENGLNRDVVEAAIAKDRDAKPWMRRGQILGGALGAIPAGIPETGNPEQWAQLAGLLLRGMITGEELASVLHSAQPEGLFEAVVELLVRKRIISEDERKGLTG